MSPRLLSLLLLRLSLAASTLPAQTAAAVAQADDTAPVSASELQTVQTLYAGAQKKEAAALAAFREIRAMQASRSLQITLEDARSRLQIPAPDRPPIDLSVLKLARPDPARVVEQRRTLRAVNARIDEILTFVRQLKAQLKEEDANAEATTLDALRAELTQRETAAELANENESEPSKDLTEKALSGEPAPADAAAGDAAIAATAATAAETMAKDATDKKTDAAPAATKAAAEARTAATEASKAAVAAKAASSAKNSAAAATHAATASAKTTEAVNASIKVAQLTGNLSFVAAIKAQAADAKSGSGQAAFTAKSLGGFHPGATKFLPDKARPSRRIGGLGTGIEWIYIDSWYILGPFPNPNRRNVDTAYPPESVIDLDATYTGDKGASLRWKFLQANAPYVVPEDPQQYVIYYAYSEIWCDLDMDLWVMIGSDDSSRIWLNDQQIWKSGYRLKPWKLDEGLRKVSFRRGINRILYRFENGWGLTGFSFAINLTPGSSSAPATGGSTGK